MGAFSDYLETKLLDYTLRGVSYTAPTSVWVGLCSAAPTDATTNELTAASTYKRMQVAFAAASTSSILGSTAAVTFPQATGTSWGPVCGYAIFDASSSGNMMYYANLASQVTVNANDQVEFATSAICVTLD